jgi:hypothetical protein
MGKSVWPLSLTFFFKLSMMSSEVKTVSNGLEVVVNENKPGL